MIYYQNGMDNSELESKEGAAYLGRKLGLKEGEVGVFSNKTQGRVEDFKEYCAPLGMKDVLNACEYERISKMSGPEERHLIVAFSAGNEDAYKAMQVLNLENRNLGGNIDFISVGSPRVKKDLEGMAEKVGGKLIGQYNNWKDPTTHPKTWVAGTAVVSAGLGFVGWTAGSAVGSGMVTGVTWITRAASGVFPATVGTMAPAKTLLEAYFETGVKVGTAVGTAAVKVGTAAVGGVAPFKKAVSNLKEYHSFQGYLDRDVQGIQEALKDWKEKNMKE